MAIFFFLKFVLCLSLGSVFVSLLHRRCLMSKFSEILMLVCRKMFSAFYPNLHETFSNSYGFPLMQKFNRFFPHLVLYDRKHFCSILTDLSNLLFLFYQKFPLLSHDLKNVLTKRFQKCWSSRSQMFFRSSRPKVFCKKGVLWNFDKFIGKHPCQSLFSNKVAGPSLSLQLYLKRDSGTSVFLWILWNF